jgi:hypothetical protein
MKCLRLGNFFVRATVQSLCLFFSLLKISIYIHSGPTCAVISVSLQCAFICQSCKKSASCSTGRSLQKQPSEQRGHTCCTTGPS